MIGSCFDGERCLCWKTFKTHLTAIESGHRTIFQKLCGIAWSGQNLSVWTVSWMFIACIHVTFLIGLQKSLSIYVFLLLTCGDEVADRSKHLSRLGLKFRLWFLMIKFWWFFYLRVGLIRGNVGALTFETMIALFNELSLDGLTCQHFFNKLHSGWYFSDVLLWSRLGSLEIRHDFLQLRVDGVIAEVVPVSQAHTFLTELVSLEFPA